MEQLPGCLGLLPNLSGSRCRHDPGSRGLLHILHFRIVSLQ